MEADLSDAMSVSEPARDTILAAVRRNDWAVARACLEAGDDVNQHDEQGVTPLMVVVHEPDRIPHVLSKCRGIFAVMLIKRGADINARDIRGDTAVHYAARGNGDGWVQLLCDYGGDMNALNNDQKSPVDVAKDDTTKSYILESKPSALRRLIHDRDLNLIADALTVASQLDPEEWQEELCLAVYAAVGLGYLDVLELLLPYHPRNLESTLADACAEGDDACAEFLLQHGTNADLVDPFYTSTPLALSAGIDNVGMMRQLVAHGADCNKLSASGRSPLMSATSRGHIAAARFLLAHGADVRIIGGGVPPKEGKTALHIACGLGHIELVQLFVEAGADLNLKCQEKTPLEKAAWRGHLDVVKWLVHYKGMIPPNCRALWNERNEAMFRAAEAGRVEVVEYLLDNGADLYMTYPFEDAIETPLYAAAGEGHCDVVRLLVERGADVNLAVVPTGRTPLINSVIDGHLPMVELLISLGARVEDCQNDGGTALLEAVQTGDVGIVKCLVENGGIVSPDPATWTAKHGVPFQPALHDAYYVACNERDGLVGADLVRILLENGARLNTRSAFGTVFVVALTFAKPEVIRQILNYGAGVINRPGRMKQMELPFMMRMRFHDVENTLEAMEVMLDYGADVHQRNAGNETAVQVAVFEGYVDIARLLLDYGASKEDLHTADGWDDLSERDQQKLLEYVPRPRFPSAKAVKVGTQTFHVMPWSRALHRSTPYAFMRMARALCLLRARLECEPTWGCLPNEVFEYGVGVLYEEIIIERQLAA